MFTGQFNVSQNDQFYIDTINLNKYKLLIIDEIGYFPVDRNIAGLFFQLVAARYEKRSVIVTTNQPLSKWGEVFGDSVIANAIIDRLVHHSKIIKITGRSYRIKGMIEESDIRSADQKSRANT